MEDEFGYMDIVKCVYTESGDYLELGKSYRIAGGTCMMRLSLSGNTPGKQISETTFFVEPLDVDVMEHYTKTERKQLQKSYPANRFVIQEKNVKSKETLL